MPSRIGGHPALDFCNTWAGWAELPSPGHEYLTSYDALAVWAQHADLLEPEVVGKLRHRAHLRGEKAHRVLGQARQLRTSLHAAALDPGDRRALAQLTGHIRRAGERVRLLRADNGSTRWDFPDDGDLMQPLHTASWAAADLLTSPHLAAVTACPGHGCGWLFLNSRGRRRWCAMSSCGNRAKVAAYAKRHQAQ